MTKEAGMLALADELDAYLKNPNNGESWSERFHMNRDRGEIIIAALRAAAVPAPDAGLVEREAIARLIASVDRYHKCRDSRPLIFTMGHDDPLTVGDLRLLLALLSRSGAGEPVAFTSQGQLDAARRGTVGSLYGKQDEFLNIPLYATPAPQVGRDPATIEAAARVADSMPEWDMEKENIYEAVARSIRALAAPAAQLTEDGETP